MKHTHRLLGIATAFHLVPVILAAVTFASATAWAEDGTRHEFKPRWNKRFIKLFDPSLGNEDCDQASQRLAACIQEKLEEYQKDPKALGDCTLGQDRCAYEDCIVSLEIAQMTCGFIQKDSEIAKALTRWESPSRDQATDIEPQPSLSCEEELADLKDKIARLECALDCSKKSGLARLECSVRCASLAIRENPSRWE